MIIKVIQLNLWQGQFLNEAVAFLKLENPDIITLQEVSVGIENRCRDTTLNIFEFLKQDLNMHGVFVPCHSIIGHPESLQGNAILTRGTVTAAHTLWMRPFKAISDKFEERDIVTNPRNALDCTIELSGHSLHTIVTHSAWTKDPVDTPEKIRQAHLLADHIKKIDDMPIIMGGDFNMPAGTETEAIISSVLHNTVTHHPSQIKRTTHPTIHKTASFLPHGLIVDFIFTSPHFHVVSIDAPEITISDHLPVRATLSFL